MTASPASVTDPDHSSGGRERIIRLDGPLDLGLTLGINRRGWTDPTIRFEPGRVRRSMRTPDGPATLVLTRHGSDRTVANAWGPGTDWSLEHVPDLLGLHDDPTALRPAHPIVAELARRATGLRIGRTGLVMEALVPAILEQKVTGREAWRAFQGLLVRYGEPAPGPRAAATGLIVPPAPATLARLPYHEFHPLGVERRRADTIRYACVRSARIEETVRLPIEDAYRRLLALPGVGLWTAAEVAVRALGDPDAVSVGDFHLPNVVSWALAGEPRGDDARMLELLEPYRGQRARVVRLLEGSGLRPPAYGPRMPTRSFEGI